MLEPVHLRIPFTFRLVFHGVRSVMRAGLLFFCAWLVFVPASPDEQAALGAEWTEKYPTGLRPMRSAQAVVAIAPDRFYVVLAEVMGPDVSPLFVRIAMAQLATGAIGPSPGERRTTSATARSDRNIDGPRFIKVD